MGNFLKNLIKDNRRAGKAFHQYLTGKSLTLSVFMWLIVVLCIILPTWRGEEISFSAFLIVFVLFAGTIIRINLSVYQKNVKENMPDDLHRQLNIRGKPLYNFKGRVAIIGHLYTRGFSVKIYIYDFEVIIGLMKNCLCIRQSENIKIEKSFFGYRVEFTDGEKYILCYLNAEQVKMLQEWQKRVFQADVSE